MPDVSRLKAARSVEKLRFSLVPEEEARLDDHRSGRDQFPGIVLQEALCVLVQRVSLLPESDEKAAVDKEPIQARSCFGSARAGAASNGVPRRHDLARNRRNALRVRMGWLRRPISRTSGQERALPPRSW